MWKKAEYVDLWSNASFWKSGLFLAYKQVRWINEFERGRTCTVKPVFSGRPISGTFEEMVEKIRAIVIEDCRIKLNEIAEIVGISCERSNRMLHGILQVKKLSAWWLPRLWQFTCSHIGRCDGKCVYEFGLELAFHPPYSSDSVPCDFFFLFPNRNNWLRESSFVE